MGEVGTLSACFQQEIICFTEDGDEMLRNECENVSLTFFDFGVESTSKSLIANVPVTQASC